jgi:hypothetical protein
MVLQKCSRGDEAAGNIGVQASLTLTSTVLLSGNLEEDVAGSSPHQPGAFNFTFLVIYFLDG